MALTQVKTTGIADDAVTEAKVANDAIGIAEMKSGTDGQIITYDASGNPTAVGPGTDGQVLTSTGAGSPPAFEDAVSEGTQVKSTGESGGTKFLREDGDGTCSWQTVSAGPTLSGSTNNTVVTVTGSNAMQGEANVVIDSSGDMAIGSATNAGANRLLIVNNESGDFVNGSDAALRITNSNASNDTRQASIAFTVSTSGVGSDGAIVCTSESAGNSNLRFFADSSNGLAEKLRIQSAGGISFNGDTAAANALDDYEEGTYTANLEVTSGSFTATNSNQLNYVKIGSFVYVNGVIGFSSPSSPGGDLRFDLPFASSSTGSVGSSEGCCGAIWNYYGASNPHGNYGWYPLHAAGLTGGSSTNVNLGILGYNGTNSNWGPIGNLVGNNGVCQFSFSYRTG